MLEVERFYRRFPGKPGDPVKPSARFGDGNAPTSWQTTEPQPTTGLDVWVAVRTRRLDVVSSWEVELSASRIARVRQDEQWFRRAANQPAAPAATAWGTAPSGWSRTRLTPTVTEAVWQAFRHRYGTQAPSAFRVTRYSGKLPPPLTPRPTAGRMVTEPLSYRVEWGTWQYRRRERSGRRRAAGRGVHQL